MSNFDDLNAFTRRDFVKVGVAAAVASIPAALCAEEPPKDKKDAKAETSDDKDILPTRLLGKTGEKVTILNQGAGGKRDARMLNAAFAAGIRYIDTADCYAKGESEKSIGQWMADKDNRKKIFLVTKDHPKTPDQWVEMLDARLKSLQTDYVDLFMLHMVEKSQIERLKSKEWAAAADKMKKSKKIRFAGFSSHAEMPIRIDSLNTAAEGGWVDATMIAYDPQLVKDNEDFNKAIDNCVKAKIGVVAMKTMRSVKDAPKFLPEFEKMGLTPHEAVLHAVWTDERIASICSDMPNIEIIKSNTEAAKKFKPLDEKKVRAVVDLYRQYAHSYCNGCDGSCRTAASTNAKLHDMVRFLAYYEMDGRLADAKRAYAQLSPEERDWRKADLAAASKACRNKLDFASLLKRAETMLA